MREHIRGPNVSKIFTDFNSLLVSTRMPLVSHNVQITTIMVLTWRWYNDYWRVRICTARTYVVPCSPYMWPKKNPKSEFFFWAHKSRMYQVYTAGYKNIWVQRLFAPSRTNRTKCQKTYQTPLTPPPHHTTTTRTPPLLLIPSHLLVPSPQKTQARDRLSLADGCSSCWAEGVLVIGPCLSLFSLRAAKAIDCRPILCCFLIRARHLQL